jgi:uncharacterized protein YndB with AHSA1/START domain/catechol 2,3-dioxygenase-like lactoylglutathione lyase family enzyme
MTADPTPRPDATRLERSYDAPAELVWELLTTAAGLEEWFAPDGFESRVSGLDLRPGGELRYTMTATAPEQIAFVRETGNPLSVELRKTFTEVAWPTRLGYRSVIDFVPGEEPYEHLTTIDIEPAGARTNVVMTVDPLHDETWTQGYRAHRDNELDNLGAAISRRTQVILGNHSAVVLPRAQRDRIREFYRQVLGCEIIRQTDLKDDFRLGGNFYIGVLYEDEGVALGENGFAKATYLELKARNVEELRRKIVAFGVRVLDLQDPHLYFQAPGGQIFRLVGIDEDLSKYEGTDHRELPSVFG